MVKGIDKKELEKTLTKTLGEFSDSILTGVEKILGKMGGKLTLRLDKLKTGQRGLQRQINDLKYDSSSRGEFQNLKEKVYRHHTAN